MISVWMTRLTPMVMTLTVMADLLAIGYTSSRWTTSAATEARPTPARMATTNGT